MKKMEKTERTKLFFPYYVNQGRLMDIYAILNGGYSEYAEITLSSGKEKRVDGKGEAKGSAGFKLLSIGGGISGGVSNSQTSGVDRTEKKVQTITSMLNDVLQTMEKGGYITDIKESKVGSFIKAPVVLKINSIKSLMQETVDLVKFANEMSKVGSGLKGTLKDSAGIEKLLKSIRVLFDGEEIIFDTEGYAVFGTILDQYLYQGNREDIIDTELTCFAQVKKVYPSGTTLLKNTIFTRIKDRSAKEKLIKSIREITEGDVFDFEATAIESIIDKPVYQIEVIALYQ